MSKSQINKDVAIRYVEELWSEGKLDVADEIISSEPENVQESGSDSNFSPENTKAMVSGVRALLSGLTRELHSITADEEYVSVNSTISGIHSGSWGYIPYPATGEKNYFFGSCRFQICKWFDRR